MSGSESTLQDLQDGGEEKAETGDWKGRGEQLVKEAEILDFGLAADEEKDEMAPDWNIDRFKNSYKSIISKYFLFMDGVLWLIFKFQPDSLSHIGGSSERTSGLLFSRP